MPGRLEGLADKLKGEERFKEKIAIDIRQMPGQSVDSIAAAVHDAVRYTFQSDARDYVDGYWQVHQRLEDSGYTMAVRRNSWGYPDYKGINTRWRTPEGQLFEVQFHTPESFTANWETHEAYEKIRSPVTSDQERQALRTYQHEVYARIPIPDDVNTIPNYPEDR